MYEVIRKISSTEIEALPRKFMFRWSADRVANRMNKSEYASQGRFAALAGIKLWQAESSRTVTALLEGALAEVKRQQEQDAYFAEQQAASGPRNTEELVKAIDAGLASEDRPARKPRATRQPRGLATTGTRAASARAASTKTETVLDSIGDVLDA